MRLVDCLRRRSNDYGEVERAFEEALGVPFTGGRAAQPSTPMPQGPDLPSVSVIVPAFNSRDTLGLLLDSLDAQTVLDRSPGAMEVLVVDDGSTDGTFDALATNARRRRYPLTLIRLRANAGRSAARNIGFLRARGNVLVLMDSDVVAPPCLVEAHALRHAFGPRLLLVAMREHIRPGHPATTPEHVRRHPDQLAPDPAKDWRVFTRHEVAGRQVVLRNVGDTRNWKDLGLGSRYLAKALPDMVIGVCLSVRREPYEAVGGFWHGFTGWGREDVFFGTMLIAWGCFAVPSLDAVYHIRHAPRSGSPDRRAEERARNASLYDRLLDRDFDRIAAEGRATLDALRAGDDVAELRTIPQAAGDADHATE